MDASYREKMYALEEDYWLFRTRREFITKLVKYADRDARILDIGCAGGQLIALLKGSGFTHVSGVDSSPKAIELCRQRGIGDCFVMEGARTEFENGRFDYVIASDVLEHIEDDGAALSEWNRILKPGGEIIIFVPAFQFLWSAHDEVNHHHRRYSKKDLMDVLQDAAFETFRTSYWNFSLFFAAIPYRIVQRFFRRTPGRMPCDHLYGSGLPAVNRALTDWVRMENKLLERINFPVGVSVFAQARKRRRSSAVCSYPGL